MSRTVTIDPVTRIEGHAKITIQLDDQGEVADARVEYKAKGYIDEAQTMGWLQRFFMNVLPF